MGPIPLPAGVMPEGEKRTIQAGRRRPPFDRGPKLLK